MIFNVGPNDSQKYPPKFRCQKNKKWCSPVQVQLPSASSAPLISGLICKCEGDDGVDGDDGGDGGGDDGGDDGGGDGDDDARLISGLICKS